MTATNGPFPRTELDLRTHNFSTTLIGWFGSPSTPTPFKSILLLELGDLFTYLFVFLPTKLEDQFLFTSFLFTSPKAKKHSS